MTDRSEYQRAYRQTEEYKLKNRANVKRYQLEKKRRNTGKRIQEHTMDELMAIVADACRRNNIEYKSVEDKYREFMEFIHSPNE